VEAGRTRTLIAIAALVVVADQLTKWVVRQQFELHDSVAVIPDFFSLTRVHNTGAAFGLLNAGAAGNLIDGLTLGYVVDFFDFYWNAWHFWAFNVADASITVGMALVILDQLGVGRHRVSGTV
jgi:signal peptidase II